MIDDAAVNGTYSDEVAYVDEVVVAVAAVD